MRQSAQRQLRDAGNVVVGAPAKLRYDVEAQALQRAADEGAQGQLFLECRVRLRTALGVDHRTIAVDALRQHRNAITGAAKLQQHLDSADVVDAIRGRN